MTDLALPGSIEPAMRKGPDLDRGFHPLSGIIFMGVVAAALLFVAYSIYVDVEAAGTPATTFFAVHPAFRSAVDRARLRVRQRFSRYGQCGRHCDLHTLAAG